MTRKKRSCERFFCAFFRRNPLLYDMAVDVGRNDSLQQDECGEQREGSVEARLVGDKADGGRPHEDAEVAERTDSWHSELMGMTCCLPSSEKKTGTTLAQPTPMKKKPR